MRRVAEVVEQEIGDVGADAQLVFGGQELLGETVAAKMGGFGDLCEGFHLLDAVVARIARQFCESWVVLLPKGPGGESFLFADEPQVYVDKEGIQDFGQLVPVHFQAGLDPPGQARVGIHEEAGAGEGGVVGGGGRVEREGVRGVEAGQHAFELADVGEVELPGEIREDVVVREGGGRRRGSGAPTVPEMGKKGGVVGEEEERRGRGLGKEKGEGAKTGRALEMRATWGRYSAI